MVKINPNQKTNSVIFPREPTYKIKKISVIFPCLIKYIFCEC